MEYKTSGEPLEDIMEEEEGATEENPNISIEPDRGECLVIRRALNRRLKHEEPKQRESIFHSRCTIRGKV